MAAPFGRPRTTPREVCGAARRAWEFRRATQPSGHPIALHVDDVEAARAELEAAGVEFAAETIDSGVCHMAFFRDPAGNALLLHHRYAPRD